MNPPRPLEVLFAGEDDGVARALVSRSDVALRWALTPKEAIAAIASGEIDLVLVPSRMARDVVAVARGAGADTIVRVEHGDIEPVVDYVQMGALVLPLADEAGTITSISHVANLAFPDFPRAATRQIVEVEIAGETHALETVDLSVSGISVLDFPPRTVGSTATVSLTTAERRIVLHATVVREFRRDGRFAAGLVFQDVERDERRILEALVTEQLDRATPIPHGPGPAPTPTGDLPVEPKALGITAVADHLAGRTDGSPWWLASVIADLTPAEKDAATGHGAAWARRALEARLFVYGLRAQAGARNLTQSHFMIARELCRDLAKHGEGEPAPVLYEITKARAAILRGLFGTEQLAPMPADKPAVAPPTLAVPISPPMVPALLADDLASERSWEKKQEEERTRAMAQKLIARGDVARAARVFAFADMLDEAIHLYLNVLGSPGDAAPLASRRWGLEHGAELYELAGQTEDAAKTWAAVARASPHPERFVGRITGLDVGVAATLLADLTASRPLSQASVELHYRHALCLVRIGEPAKALSILQAIARRVGAYKDVERRLVHLGRRVATESGDFERALDPPAPEPSSGEDAVPIEAVPSPDTQEIVAIAVEAGAAAQRSVSTTPLDADLIGDLLDDQEHSGPHPRVLSDEALPALLTDDVIEKTRGGPTFDEIVAKLPSLGGATVIDAWYWLALINMRRGAWNAALEFLDRIDKDSPGYRKAKERALAIRAWQASMRARVTNLEIEGASASISGEKSAARYVLRGELGRGPQAVVFRALDRRTSRDVALKLFTQEARARWTDSRSVLQRFTAAARIHHPNVAAIWDFGELEGRPYVATELVEDDRAPRTKPSLVETLRRAERLSAAVAAGHRADLPHGAIKPSNVLVGPMGVVKLADFAPSLPAEQTPAGDVFAIGAWLYVAVTGRAPFDDDRSGAAPRPIGRKWLDALFARVLSPAPSDRFASAEALGTFLTSVLERAQKASPAEPDHASTSEEPHGDDDVISRPR